jgi:serine/threonine protein kinase
VPLIGYCSELKGKTVQRLLVFDYMSNGNLRDRLDGVFGKNMDWSTRVTIALGAARGLEYLHEAAAPRILHRDVKSTNILLDKNWQAKVGLLVVLYGSNKFKFYWLLTCVVIFTVKFLMQISTSVLLQTY